MIDLSTVYSVAAVTVAVWVGLSYVIVWAVVNGSDRRGGSP